jgi:hypothetical protein
MPRHEISPGLQRRRAPPLFSLTIFGLPKLGAATTAATMEELWQ